MKIILWLLMLTFTLTVSAQKLKWETPVQLPPPLPSGWQISTSTAVFPDGVGGGAIILRLLKPGADFFQCVWFDSRGKILATNAQPFIFNSGYPENRLKVLRVTSRVLDLAAFDYTDFGSTETVKLRRFVKGKAVVETPLRSRTPYILNEQLASELPPVVDRLGFFTTQWTVTNLVVRRYTF